MMIDFGMTPCPACGEMLFIDLEGRVHLSATAEAEPPEAPAAFESAIDVFESVSPIEVTTYEPVHESTAETIAVSQDEAPFALPNLDDGPVDQPNPGFVSTPEDPLGLNAFANSELSQAKDGPLVFRLFISGIDSKEMRENIREALTDSRFGWNATEILSRSTMGLLSIDGVSPIKAAVLVNRLKRFPLRIRWEQYAVVQMEATPIEDDSSQPDSSDDGPSLLE